MDFRSIFMFSLIKISFDYRSTPFGRSANTGSNMDNDASEHWRETLLTEFMEKDHCLKIR